MSLCPHCWKQVPRICQIPVEWMKCPRMPVTDKEVEEAEKRMAAADDVQGDQRG